MAEHGKVLIKSSKIGEGRIEGLTHMHAHALSRLMFGVVMEKSCTLVYQEEEMSQSHSGGRTKPSLLVDVATSVILEQFSKTELFNVIRCALIYDMQLKTANLWYKTNLGLHC